MKHFFFAFCLLLTTVAGRSQDTAGTYLPVVSGAVNSTITANIAHFIQVDSEMYIIGKVFVRGTTNAGQGSHFGISIPVRPAFLFPIHCMVSAPFINLADNRLSGRCNARAVSFSFSGHQRRQRRQI